jgi:hypothetical protein
MHTDSYFNNINTPIHIVLKEIEGHLYTSYMALSITHLSKLELHSYSSLTERFFLGSSNSFTRWFERKM